MIGHATDRLLQSGIDYSNCAEIISFDGTTNYYSLFSSLQSNKEEFIKLFKTYNRLLLLILGFFILFILVMPTLVDWIFNQKYHDSIPFLLPLSVGWSIRSSTFYKAQLFLFRKIHYNAYTALCALIEILSFIP